MVFRQALKSVYFTVRISLFDVLLFLPQTPLILTCLTLKIFYFDLFFVVVLWFF